MRVPHPQPPASGPQAHLALPRGRSPPPPNGKPRGGSVRGDSQALSLGLRGLGAGPQGIRAVRGWTLVRDTQPPGPWLQRAWEQVCVRVSRVSGRPCGPRPPPPSALDPGQPAGMRRGGAPRTPSGRPQRVPRGHGDGGARTGDTRRTRHGGKGGQAPSPALMLDPRARADAPGWGDRSPHRGADRQGLLGRHAERRERRKRCVMRRASGVSQRGRGEGGFAHRKTGKDGLPEERAETREGTGAVQGGTGGRGLGRTAVHSPARAWAEWPPLQGAPGDAGGRPGGREAGTGPDSGADPRGSRLHLLRGRRGDSGGGSEPLRRWPPRLRRAWATVSKTAKARTFK